MDSFTLDSEDLIVLRAALAAYEEDIASPEYANDESEAGWRSSMHLGDPYYLIENSVCASLERLLLLEDRYRYDPPVHYRITDKGRKVLATT